ncbi:Cys-Gly metallodipeptidase [Exserohilum turcicum]
MGACAWLSSATITASRGRSSKMPRLPLPALAPRFAAFTQPPARIIPAPAHSPRVTASTSARRFLHPSHPSHPLLSPSSPVFAATPRRLVHSIPKRISNADWPYLYHAFDNMAQLDPYFKQVDGLQSTFIERLREAVAIPSISSEDQRRPDVVKMGHWLADQIKALGGTVELRELGKQPGREHLDLPPCLLGRYGNDPNKLNVLVYGHYDVQPANKSDGWATDPFTLSIDDKGRMYGRGSTDDKGPVLGWLNAIEAHQKAGVELPVNLVMCFEGMEENGSEGLDETIRAEAKKFFKDVDVVCISDNYWLGTEKPCLTYGVRGCNYYQIEISGPGQDLHSGVYGGMTHEPMTDLVRIMNSLVDPDGKILIKGIDELVAPLTEQEAALYPPIAFTMDGLKESLGGAVTIHDNKEEALMHKMRYPSLSLHGIEGAFYSEGAKTVIPAKVIGKFSIRTVPNMEIDPVTKLVEKHINDEFAKLKSKNTMKFSVVHCGKWWVEDPNHPNYTAAAKAVERVFGVKPDMTREGGSIPVTLTFQEELGKNVLLLPMGSSTDAAHSINEKLDKMNYIEGTKLLGAYLHYVAAEMKRS